VRSPLGDRIEALLQAHRGAENAIAAPDIALAVGLPADGREVRRIIAGEFQQWIGPGVMLCSAPGKGFFFATEAEQIARKQFCLIALKLEAGGKLADYQHAMRLAGFGGLVTDTLPEPSTPRKADGTHFLNLKPTN
jgi:hypothetical protein